MTLTTTTLAPKAELVPFISPVPSQDLWNSIIPRGEIIFSEIGTAIITGGAGNEQRIVITLNLPAGYAYAFREFSFYLEDVDDAGDVNDWDDTGSFAIQSDSTSATASKWVWYGQITKPAVAGHSTIILLNGTYQLGYPEESLSKIIIPAKAGAKASVQLFNVVQDGGAMYSNLYARFLQYDLNQAYRSILQTPVPVR